MLALGMYSIINFESSTLNGHVYNFAVHAWYLLTLYQVYTVIRGAQVILQGGSTLNVNSTLILYHQTVCLMF